MSAWTVKERKKSWDAVFDQALAGEPQFVSRGDNKTVVVISLQSYMSAVRPERQTLFQALRSCPGGGVEIDVSRDPSDTGRNIDLP